jgi:hypothetical protein
MRILALATMAFLAAAPVAAQQHAGHGQQQNMSGMQICMEMLGGPPPAMILQHREQLGLSADQVTRLESIQAPAAAASHMQPAQAAHQAAAALLKTPSPDFSAYEAKLREAANHMVLAHTAMARAAVQARAVLNADQRTRLESAIRDMQHGEGGMMQHGEGSMMSCMMMGGMGARPGSHNR